jgi:hypothetical protein
VVLDAGLEAVQPIDLRALAGRTCELELSTRAYRATQTPRSMGDESAAPLRRIAGARASDPGAQGVKAFLRLINVNRFLPPAACASLRMIALKFLRSENVNRTYFRLRTMRTVNPAYPVLSEPEQRMTP